MKYYIFCISLMIALACTKPDPTGHDFPYIQRPDLQSQALTLENVYAEIMKNDIKFSEIVLRQCILETGWLKSYNCLHRNNLFGMTGATPTKDNPNGYATYDQWQHSVRAYKRWQRHMYGDSDLDYYLFLESIGYATSPEYIKKLKSIKIVVVCQ